MTYYTNMSEQQQLTKGEARKAQILSAARVRIIEQGYDALVMRSLAESLDMKIGNLQYYFATREVLVEAVVRAEAETDLADLRAHCAEEGDSKDQFDRFVAHIINKWRGDSGKILGIMGFLAQHNTVFAAMYRDIYKQFYDELADVVACLDETLPKGECMSRAKLITALLDGASMQVQQGGSRDFASRVARAAYDLATS